MGIGRRAAARIRREEAEEREVREIRKEEDEDVIRARRELKRPFTERIRQRVTSVFVKPEEEAVRERARKFKEKRAFEESFSKGRIEVAKQRGRKAAEEKTGFLDRLGEVGKRLGGVPAEKPRKHKKGKFRRSAVDFGSMPEVEISTPDLNDLDAMFAPPLIRGRKGKKRQKELDIFDYL